MKALIFKLGHDETNINHTFNYATKNIEIISRINSSNPGSKYYNSNNRWLSEFSTIEDILEKLNSKQLENYTHIGIISYRTLFGDYDVNKSYKQVIHEFCELVENTLNSYDGIISPDWNLGDLPNYIARARWTGSLSMDIISEALIDDPTLHTAWNEYQVGYHNSYRTICVLPKDEFLYLFNLVHFYVDDFMKLRKYHDELFPRSVGYELETFTSFLLTESMKSHNYARIKHTILQM